MLGATIDFIGCWLKASEHNFIEHSNMYVLNMEKLFHKTPVELPKQTSPNKKIESLLHAIVCGRYVNKLGQKLPPLNKRKSSKKTQNRRMK